MLRFFGKDSKKGDVSTLLNQLANHSIDPNSLTALEKKIHAHITRGNNYNGSNKIQRKKKPSMFTAVES